MALRPLLTRLAEHPDGAALVARRRPRVRVAVAAALPRRRAGRRRTAADRPTLVVAGDDRQARDLAADLRAWLDAAARALLPQPRRRLRVAPRAAAAPRRPARRRARRAARGARRRRGAAGRRRQRRRAEREGARPGAAPARLHDPRRATCSTSTRSASDLVAAGYERVDQVDDRGQFAIRGGILDVYPATEDRAVRVDLFDIEIESLRWFSTFTQRSLGETDGVEIAPAAELAPEHRELAEIAALEDAEERPDVAELLPVDRFRAFLDLAPADAADPHRRRGGRRRRRWPTTGRTSAPPSTTTTPTTSTSSPTRSRAALDARARVRLSSISRRPADRVPRPGRRPRRPLAQARPSPSSRSSCARATARSSPGRAAARASAPPTTSRALRAVAGTGGAPAAAVRARPRLRDGFVAAGLQARRHPRAPALPPPPRRARGGGADARGAARCARSPTCAPATSSSTRTTASRASPASTPRPSPASPATTWSSSSRAPTRSSCRSTSWRRSRRYVGAGGAHPPLTKLGGKALGDDEGARPARRPGARRRAAQPLRRAPPPAGPRLPRGRRVAARVRGALPLPGDARPARGDRARQGRHGARRGRWTA